MVGVFEGEVELDVLLALVGARDLLHQVRQPTVVHELTPFVHVLDQTLVVQLMLHVLELRR